MPLRLHIISPPTCLRRSACPPQGFWRRGFAQAGSSRRRRNSFETHLPAPPAVGTGAGRQGVRREVNCLWRIGEIAILHKLCPGYRCTDNKPGRIPGGKQPFVCPENSSGQTKDLLSAFCTSSRWTSPSIIPLTPRSGR